MSSSKSGLSSKPAFSLWPSWTLGTSWADNAWQFGTRGQGNVLSIETRITGVACKFSEKEECHQEPLVDRRFLASRWSLEDQSDIEGGCILKANYS